MSSEQADLWRDCDVSRVVSRQVAIIHRKRVRYIEYEIKVQDIMKPYFSACRKSHFIGLSRDNVTDIGRTDHDPDQNSDHQPTSSQYIMQHMVLLGPVSANDNPGTVCTNS